MNCVPSDIMYLHVLSALFLALDLLKDSCKTSNGPIAPTKSMLIAVCMVHLYFSFVLSSSLARTSVVIVY